MNNEINIVCEDYCGIINIWKDDESDYFYLQHFRSSFIREQDTILDAMKKYLRQLWYAILNKNYPLYDVVINRNNFDNLIVFCEKNKVQNE